MGRLTCLGAFAAMLFVAGAAAGGEIHWSYEGEAGPERWGGLSESFSACSSGRMQSPIDIRGAASGGGGEAAFTYRSTALDLVNNGHTVQVNVEPGQTASLGGKSYELLQFHFHSPSEHQIGGKSAAMEAHFVHRNEAGELAVVGVLIEAGAGNEALDAIADNMPTAKGAVKVSGASVNGAALLPSSLAYTAYLGSLTTPPCSEGVRWFVMKEQITASAEQIAAMQAAMPRNARPTQPLNGRITQSSN